jgi:hypothetical protein
MTLDLLDRPFAASIGRAWAAVLALAAFATMDRHFCALAAEPAACDAAPGEGYRYLGKIKLRHAREIESSNWSIGAETMDRDFTVYANWKQYLGPLGAKKARIQSGWAKTEKERGKYDWAWLDEIVSDMVDQGVEPWVCLCYGNPIYPGGGGTGLGGGLPTSDEALAAWQRYVATVVDRYKQHVDEWEVWNEPSLRGANSGDVYADFLVRTAEAIRGRQPKAKVLGLSLPGIPLDWTEQVLKRLRDRDKLGLVDQLTYHPYSYNPDDSYGNVEKLRELVKKYSQDIEVRQGENGAPSKPGSFGALSKYDWDEQRQAKWALRRLLGDLGRDIPSSYFSICDMQYPDRTNFKGLLAINDDKTVAHVKPAYRAIQHLTAIFDHRLARIPDYQARVEGGAAATRFSVFGYRRQDGSHVATIWRSSDPPGKRPEIETVTLTIAGARFERPVWVDLASGRVHEIDKSLWTHEARTSTFHRLPVYDSPILVAEAATIAVGAPR